MQRLFLLLALALPMSACAGSIVGGAADDDRNGGSNSDDPNDPNSPNDPNDPNDPNGNSDDPDDPDAPTTCEEAAGTKVLVRRLSHVEYNRTIHELFPSFQIPERNLADDLKVHGFENAAASLNPSTVLIEQYADSAASISEQVGANMGAFLPCATITPDMDCGREMIATFGLRAFRRPLTDEERGRYEAFFEQQLNAISFRGALELTVQAMLQAPQFLYRIELGVPEDGEAIVALTDYEMATRLSYFLWETMPDDELFEAAANGELHTPEQVANQARRMLDDERSAEAVLDFHRQWLSLDRVLGENKDPTQFPEWNDSLRSSMREESDRFIRHIYDERGDMLNELLTSRTTYVNQTLADFYGVSFSGGDWEETTLPEDERSGILTRGNFLAAYAHSTNGSPPLRGVAVLDKMLCDPPPPPPGNADTSTPVNTGTAPKTNRDLFEERTSPELCASCHDDINGLGFGFEAYDAMGAFRTTDNGLPVDATGEIRKTDDIDGDYDGAIELSERLASSTQVQECMVRNWFRYAFAREPKTADRCSLTDYTTALMDNDGDVREMLVSIASSHDFMHRRAAEE